MVAVEADASPARFSMGRVVTRTFEMFARNFVSFCALALIILVPQMLLQWWWGIHALVTAVPRASVNSAVWLVIEHMGVALVVSVILNCVLQAALVHGTVATLNGNRAGFFEYLSTGLRTLPRVIGIGFLTTICFMLGAVLFIVPGIIVATMLIVSVPASIVENRSVLDSLSRSTELTKGHRWAIFGLVVVFALLNLGAAIGIRPLAGLPAFPMPHAPVSIGNFSIFWLANTVLQVVSTAIGAVGVASIYFELRSIREGIGPEQLAAVFA